jgi:predicted N-acetyltransferase YhbS
MLEHSTYHDAELPAHLRWQVLSFMRIEWPFIFRRANRLSKHIHDPALHPFHFAVVEDEVLFSYGTVVSMYLQHAGETYKVYGLANVLTYPPYRKEGHGRHVVDAATTYIKASDADVAALFCDPSLKHFYATSGWEAIESAATVIGPADNPQPFSALKMMLFVSKKGHVGRAAFEQQAWHIPYHW